jgi:hypothetical protein
MQITRHIIKALSTKAATSVAKPIALVAGTLTGTATASAQETLQQTASVTEASIIEDIGAAERIEAADKLRTLSQEVSASACFYFNDIGTEDSRARMLTAQSEFRRNYDALLKGNPAMNIIGGETRRKTLEELAKIEALWIPIEAAVDLIAADREDVAALNIIKDNAASLFALTDHLVSELSGEYSNPAELLLVDVLMLDLSGRQSMLSQKISKNACKIWTREEADTARSTLIEDMQTFELGLNALRHGMEALGLKPAPTPEIADGLDAVIVAWSETRPSLDELVENGTLSEAAQAEIYEQMNKKTKTLEDITHAYVAYSKHKYE